MATDVFAAADFYATARGAMAARLLRERLAALWPPAAAGGPRNLTFLGLGYAPPYLELWREGAARCIALAPAPGGVTRWPEGAPNLCCSGPEDALPFPDLSFDRVLIVHGLEAADHARRMLRAVWRVLRDDGRLLLVVPNRVGVWAQIESTPFGQGQPYSAGQIGRVLAASLFRVERRDTALFLPPTNLRLMLRGSRLWEAAGRRLMPGLGGVTISEAVKDVYAAVPLRARQRRKMVVADAA
jgi:SAM-dependent methyltransferase